MSRKGTLAGGVKTDIYEEDRYTCVKYHDTVVVKWNPFEIILHSGGWQTVTTKRRMNQASNDFHLGFSVYQKAGDWFVTWKEEVYPFEDGMVLVRKPRPE